jgi:type IV pilus assembly protein PilA
MGERGYTLIEILVVVVIIGVLAAVAVVAVGGIGDEARASACIADERNLESAIGAFRAKADDASAPNPTEADLVTAGFLHDESTMHDIDPGTGLVEGIGDCP